MQDDRPTEVPAGIIPLTVSDRLLTVAQSAGWTGLSRAAFWRAVRDGRLPAPVYPAPRAPRWFLSELRAAIEGLRQMPAQAMAARRAARLTSRVTPGIADQDVGRTRTACTGRVRVSSGGGR